VEQHARVTTSQHEAAECGREDDETSNDDQHASGSTILCARQEGAQAEDGLRVDLANA
jgi:hypothetical protein